MTARKAGGDPRHRADSPQPNSGRGPGPGPSQIEVRRETIHRPAEAEHRQRGNGDTTAGSEEDPDSRDHEQAADDQEAVGPNPSCSLSNSRQNHPTLHIDEVPTESRGCRRRGRPGIIPERIRCSRCIPRKDPSAPPRNIPTSTARRVPPPRSQSTRD